MDLYEKTVNKNYVYKGKIIKVRRDDAELPNGNMAVREVVEHTGGVAILAIEDDCVYTVEQYRYPFEEVIIELPAGKLNENEDPLACAARELKEETGLDCKSLKYIGGFYPSPGYALETLHVYVAEGLSKGDSKLDPDEFLNVKKIKLSEIRKLIENNTIKDAKTVIALLYYFNYLRKE